MASVALSRRVERVVGYPPLSEMGRLTAPRVPRVAARRRQLRALPGRWQAAIITAERNRPKLRLVSDAWSSPNEVRFADGRQ
jgi:hypothetical protein